MEVHPGGPHGELAIPRGGLDCAVPTVAERWPWTSERLELRRRLWIEGGSASEIARRLGRTTRSAVLHKAHRLGLGGRVERPLAGCRRVSSG